MRYDEKTGFEDETQVGILILSFLGIMTLVNSLSLSDNWQNEDEKEILHVELCVNFTVNVHKGLILLLLL